MRSSFQAQDNNGNGRLAKWLSTRHQINFHVTVWLIILVPSLLFEVVNGLVGWGVPTGVGGLVGVFFTLLVELLVFAVGSSVDLQMCQAQHGELSQATEKTRQGVAIAESIRSISEASAHSEYVKRRDDIVPEQIENQDVEQAGVGFEKLLAAWNGRLQGAPELSDPWRLALELYLVEEIRDLNSKIMVTNSLIYSYLLISFVKYFVETYQKDAMILVLTSLDLPSWSEGGKSWKDEQLTDTQRSIIARYKADFTKYTKIKRNIPALFGRYMACVEDKAFCNEYDLPGYNDLQTYAKSHSAALSEYLQGLHFGDEQAYYLKWDRMFHDARGDPAPPDAIMRDLLFFGFRGGNGAEQWIWAISSSLGLDQETVMVRLYDREELTTARFQDRLHGELIRELRDPVNQSQGIVVPMSQ